MMGNNPLCPIKSNGFLKSTKQAHVLKWALLRRNFPEAIYFLKTCCNIETCDDTKSNSKGVPENALNSFACQTEYKTFSYS